VKRPPIGITTYHRDVGASRQGTSGASPQGTSAGRPRFHVPAAYVDAVRGAGGLPVLLPPGETRPAELLDVVAGLVLCGGGDIDPAQFGGHAGHEAQYATCSERDAFELDLVCEALGRGTPTLAICRGMQILNVSLGGALHVHLPDVVGESVAHRVSRERHTYHGVRVAPESQLAAVLGGEELRVASWHHQGIARLGAGLRAAAWAEDGTIEAVEIAGRPEVMAVQWHPEIQFDEPDGRQRRLFEDLVRRARGVGTAP